MRNLKKKLVKSLVSLDCSSNLIKMVYLVCLNRIFVMPFDMRKREIMPVA